MDTSCLCPNCRARRRVIDWAEGSPNRPDDETIKKVILALVEQATGKRIHP